MDRGLKIGKNVRISFVDDHYEGVHLLATTRQFVRFFKKTVAFYFDFLGHFL